MSCPIDCSCRVKNECPVRVRDSPTANTTATIDPTAMGYEPVSSNTISTVEIGAPSTAAATAPMPTIA